MKKKMLLAGAAMMSVGFLVAAANGQVVQVARLRAGLAVRLRVRLATELARDVRAVFVPDVFQERWDNRFILSWLVYFVDVMHDARRH